MSDVSSMTISEDLLPRRLPVLGHVKIGGLKPAQTSSSGKDFQPPVKFDHFRITKRTRGNDGNYELDRAVHEALGTEKPTVLDVRLPFDTRAENFYAQMVHYQGRTEKTHQCDGVTCLDPRTGTTHPCERRGGGSCPCKPYGRLALILEAAPTFGGIYVYRTTSWETVSSIQTFLGVLEKKFPTLSALPMRLELYPAEITYQSGNQKRIGTAYRVALELRASWEQTLKAAVEYQRVTASARAEMLQLAPGIREELDAIDEAEAEVIGQEYFPSGEAQTEREPSPLKRMNREIQQQDEEAEGEDEGHDDGSKTDELVDQLRQLMARAEASEVLLTQAQVEKLQEAIDGRTDAELQRSIEWITKKLPEEED